MQNLSLVCCAALIAAITFGCGTELDVPARLSGFLAPESVLYDAEHDVYWVSNIGAGGPLARDGDGFISRVDAGDGAIDRRFISGALDAPKGMAIAGGKLYVADIDRVRIFDRDTGRPLEERELAGAEFLNDVAAGEDGAVYVTDMAVDAAFMPTGHDAIYRLAEGSAPERWIEGPDLGLPNGLAITGDAIWLATFGGGELIELGFDRTIRARHAAPQGGLDGIAPIGGDRFLVTSWAAGAVFLATRAGMFELERDGVASPADLGFDPSRERVLIPLLDAGEVLIDAVDGL